MPFPLPDTRATGVGHNRRADPLEISEDTVPFSRITDLLGTGLIISGASTGILSSAAWRAIEAARLKSW